MLDFICHKLSNYKLWHRLAVLSMIPLVGLAYYATELVLSAIELAEEKAIIVNLSSESLNEADNLLKERRAFLTQVEQAISEKKKFNDEIDKNQKDKQEFLQVVDSIIGDIQKSKDELQVLKSTLNTHDTLANFLQAIQLERDLSLGYLGSNGRFFKKELQQATKSTDKKFEQIKTIYPPLLAKVDKALPEKLTQIKKMMKRLIGKREKTQALKALALPTMDYYLIISENTFDLIEGLSSSISDNKLQNILASYTNIMRVIDLVSQERAYITYTLAIQDFNPTVFQRFIAILARIDVYKKLFESWSSPELKATYFEKHKQKVGKKVKTQRASIINYDEEMGFDSQPIDFFNDWSLWLKDLQLVKSQTTDSLKNWTDALIEKNDSLIKDNLKKKQLSTVEQDELATNKAHNLQEISNILAKKKSSEQLINATEDKIKTITLTKKQTEEDLEQAQTKQKIVIVASIIGISITALFTFLVFVSIIRPLVALLEGFNHLTKDDADLTYRIQVKGKDELAQVANEFNSFSSRVASMISQVQSVVLLLVKATEQLNIVNNENTASTQKQQNNTNSITSAIVGVNQQVELVASSATEATVSANEANQQADIGKNIVDDTVKSIKALAHEINHTTNVINELSNDSESISQILDVIGSIAEQTNLLALNAAIEAARAGEQGRGFAVVADEVRTLAARTQDATQEIKIMIDKLQKGSRTAVTMMEKGNEQVNDSVIKAMEADSVLLKVNRSVLSIRDKNDDIDRASQEQLSRVNQINQDIDEIKRMTEGAQERTEQLQDVNNTLSTQASELKKLVGQFKAL